MSSSSASSTSIVVDCQSIITRVVVHARGALVTREVTLPETLQSGVVDVAVSGVTLAAMPGSVRASLDNASERIVSAVHAEIVYPDREIKPGPTLTRVRDLETRGLRLDDEHRALSDRRKRLIDLALTPHVRVLDERKRERDAFDVRFTEALQMTKLLDGKIARIDAEILALEKEQRDVARAVEAARLEDRQTSSRERMGAEHPSRTITARLVGEGRAGRLLMTYAIEAARWWPTYTLRVDSGGAGGGPTQAMWTFEAIVAQKSGEDWSAVALALSSADLIFDARLPELPSLRFGRAQPPRKRPYRPAPEGIDAMFDAYLAFGGGAFAPRLPPPPSPAFPSSTTTRAPAPMAAAITGGPPALENAFAAWPRSERPADDEDTAVGFQASVPDVLAMSPPQQQQQQRPTNAMPPMPGRGAPPPHAPQAVMPAGMVMKSAAPPPAARRMRALSKGGGLLGGMFDGAAGGGGGAGDELSEQGYLSDARGAVDGYGYDREIETDLVPSDAWTDYDALVLASADDSSRRGRLVPRGGHDGYAQITRAATQELEAIASSDARVYRDPAESRGMFDHRYDASGRADVPSDGRVHRVMVGAARAPSRVEWRTVPLESPEVYREAHLSNPFDMGLLGGPVDVYLDGSLITTTMIDRIDRGGVVRCGMGVDDRLKVARNVRVDEESAGLLGGSTAVTHTIEIEISSSVKDPVKVVVLERVPISDDKALEVKIVRANPVPEPYDQSDRDAPVRGGCRFEPTVAAGKKTKLELVYKLVFAQKLDIVGGSRRG